MKKLFLLPVLVLGFGLAGCGSEPESPAPPAMTAAEIDAKIAEVEADPKMPADAKTNVIANLKVKKAALDNPPASPEKSAP